jgi:DNA gyrase subunit B
VPVALLVVQPPDDIIALIRKRPAMFVGDMYDGSGLQHLLWEVVSNAVDEHLAGFGKRITITLGDEGRVTVEDEGRGISIEQLDDGEPLLVHVLTHYHNRATFDGHPRHVHLDGGGVGLVAVSALSRHVVVETTRARRRYRVETVRGEAKPLEDLGPTRKKGTRVMFLPDWGMFTWHELDASWLRKRLFEIAAFCPQLAFHLLDERHGDITCPRGLEGLLTRQHPGFHAALAMPLSAGTEQDGIRVDVVLSFAKSPWGAGVRSYLNLSETLDGGSHVVGLMQGVRSLVPRDAPDRARVVKELRRRLVAIVSVLHHDPTFDRPTRSMLKSPEVRPIVASVVRKCLRAHAKRRPEEVRALLDTCARGDG